jgi:hypothetical protein
MAQTTTVTDVNADLRAQIEAALGHLRPELDGLRLLASAPVSGKLENAIQDRIKARVARIQLCEAVISALDMAADAFGKLEKDGFPNMTDPSLSPDTAAELQAQLDKIAAGAGALPQPARPRGATKE